MLIVKKDNIAILVNSFDGYSDLWEIFWDIFEKFGGDCPFTKYIVSNEIGFVRSGVKNIKVGKVGNMRQTYHGYVKVLSVAF